MQKFWLFFQGKKTAFGFLILLLMQETWFLDMVAMTGEPFKSMILWFAKIIGMTFAGVGIGDKLYKYWTGNSYADLRKKVEGDPVKQQG